MLIKKMKRIIELKKSCLFIVLLVCIFMEGCSPSKKAEYVEKTVDGWDKQLLELSQTKSDY